LDDFATGYPNISNVVVVAPGSTTPLVVGADYTVDPVTGVITLIEKKYMQSVASLGTLDPDDTVAVRLFAGWDISQNQNGIDWEARSLTLTSAGEATPLASVDFRNGNEGFTVFNTGSPAEPWSYSADLGLWRAGGSAVVSDSSLSSPAYAVTQTGEVTLTLRHRHNFELNWDGGQIQISINNAPWETVEDTSFSANPYLSTISASGDPDGGVLNTGTKKAFSGKSAGYDNFEQTITSLQITFSSPALPFSTVPSITDADIGSRIEPDTDIIAANAYGITAPVYVGYIHQRSGNAFNVDAYKDPFVHGFDEAAKGAIIGVNNLTGNDELEVWWYKKSKPTSAKITGVYWPSFVQKYRLDWPTAPAPAEIVLASNKGSDDLPSLEATGTIYQQNNPAEPGYNPNEEHALMLNGRAWALRDDLNVTTNNGLTWTSSAPYVLLQYSEADGRPSMTLFKVLREKGSDTFNYPAVAGKILQSPMPLPLLPAPLLADGTLASYEMPGVSEGFLLGADITSTDAFYSHYPKFTWTDRKGNKWVYRGPHQNDPSTAPTLKMRYFYTTLPGFDFPSRAIADQPEVGTITPYLRNGRAGSYLGDPVTGEISTATGRKEQPLNVTFRPTWPDAAPELRLGETLTLPKLGLPQVRGQQSAELIYQQSIALDNASDLLMANRQKSARLFDPTRAKVYPLGGSASPAAEVNNLPSIPASVNTSPYLGKLYFPNLPPHLSGRLYFDPAVGKYGALVFKGLFMDELFGEKYLQLNVLSEADLLAAQELVPEGANGKSKWDTAIVGLATSMETFVEDPGKKGTFIVDTDNASVSQDISRFRSVDGEPFYIPTGTEPFRDPVSVYPEELAEVFHSDTAVDSYAISASGGGDGYVVLAVGNGRNTDITSKDGPVSLEIFKIKAPLYRGELKVINSSNPLDEKLTLQHTGDFAGHPEEYDFEWRYAPPADGLPLKLYSFARKIIVAGNNDTWRVLHNPVNDVLNPSNDYQKYRSPNEDDTSLPAITPQQELTINNGLGSLDHGASLPYALIRKTFYATQAPLRLFLSLELGSNDGADIYLNGARVASWHSPLFEDTATAQVPATAPAFDPLTLVFEIDPSALIVDLDGIKPTANVFTVELFTTADAESKTTFNLRLEGSQEVENLAGWLPAIAEDDVASSLSKKNGEASPVTSGIVAVKGKNRHTIQGSSILTLSDNYIIMRYRARDESHKAYRENGGWSKWTEPQLAEGWIKRVLAGINPFQQRIKDLFNHETNTSVSLVEQAGKRWEGNIALNLDNVNDSGLLEIYETVLNRGKDLSISGTPAINYGGANDALLLASGYLSDLYMILGNEAYADASNSTIAFNTDTAANFVTQYGDVATALFAFKGQLATVLDEELALLRGRDDFLLPGTQAAPVYNRMVWNYTRGIDSGEAIYALNYNIKDRVWDYSINSSNPAELPADGVISAADAATSYPQGHGDAYGHYLTALTGYYHLLNNEFFTWTPRIEAVLVLGKPVSVDYQDERKFASAAAALSRTASETLELTYRQQYSADEDVGWEQLKDGKANTNTGTIRQWGTDDWASRGGQGALFNWVTANSLLPAVDPNPNHSGIQKIDRTTVPELAEIAAQAANIQQTLDHADARLNPLGLGAGSLAFDISPSEVDAGKTHYEQIYERAVMALHNAVDAFKNAKGSTQFLRQQEDTLESQRNVIEAQEQSFTNRLIELYGTPYTDDIGPGKTYKQGYSGPDLYHSMLVDLPEIFDSASMTTTGTTAFDLIETASLTGFGGNQDENQLVLNTDGNAIIHYEVDAEGRFTKPGSWSGRRVSPGRIQTAISNEIVARRNLLQAVRKHEKLLGKMTQQISLYNAEMQHRTKLSSLSSQNAIDNAAFKASLAALKLATSQSFAVRELVKDVTDGIVEGVPKSVGLANDATFAVRAAAYYAKAIKTVLSGAAQGVILASTIGIKVARGAVNATYNSNVNLENWKVEHAQLYTELQLSLSDQLEATTEVDATLRSYDQAKRDLYTLQAQGDSIQQERLVFRQHAAALIQGYRTRDFAFRAFRDEALERYKALFDLSARYTYLAASAYDYETGLLDADGNASASEFYEKIVQSRALGVVSNGQPQFAGSSTGDPGLSGVLAELSGDWSVAKTRLGFNNPDRYTTTFSLRQEKFRMVPGSDGDLPWKDKLSSYSQANILDDPDVKRYCMQVGDEYGSAVPGIVIPFSSSITTGYNFFGQPLAGGDHTFTTSSFSTKIRSSGIAFVGYVGMDSPTTTSGALADIGASSPSSPDSSFGDSDALSATPYIYLIPVGADSMRSPPLGDVSQIRTWSVQDQAIPLPFNIANSDYSTQPAWVSAASLSEPAFTIRKHQAFRAVPEGTNFQNGVGFTNSRLIGRSVWNSEWKIVIPGDTLLNDPNLGIETFLNTVKDIKLHLETYSYSGN
jgi:hypothetical protein